MNPAALMANIDDVPTAGQVIVDTDEFTKRALTKVGYAANPIEDGSLDAYRVHPVPLTSLTVGALADFDLSKKEAERAKNMFALGSYRGSTLAPLNKHCNSCGTSSGANPRSWLPISRPSRRVGPSVKPPKCSQSDTK